MSNISWQASLQTGLLANRPSVPNNARGAPAFYYATDNGVLYAYQGNTWSINDTNNGDGSWVSVTPSTVAVGAALTAPAAPNVTYLLNQASGSVLTLPAATGSGRVVNVVVTVTATSNAHKVLAASASDKLIGNVSGQNANTAKPFSAASASGFHSLQMPFAGSQPSGGFEGDWFDLQDIAANTWLVTGLYQAGTTPTTPFSTSTS